MQHHTKGDVSTHSQAKRENNPLAYHDEKRLQITERAAYGVEFWSSRKSSESYTAGVLADSISVAVIRLER
jgi:hypothetical protein